MKMTSKFVSAKYTDQLIHWQKNSYKLPLCVQQFAKFQKAKKVLTSSHNVSQHKVLHSLNDTIYVQALDALVFLN